MSQGGWRADDGLPQMVPTVYLNASQCGELVPTTHTAFWEEGAAEMTSTAASLGARTAGPSREAAPVERPAAYGRDAVRDRLNDEP